MSVRHERATTTSDGCSKLTFYAINLMRLIGRGSQRVLRSVDQTNAVWERSRNCVGRCRTELRGASAFMHRRFTPNARSQSPKVRRAIAPLQFGGGPLCVRSMQPPRVKNEMARLLRPVSHHCRDQTRKEPLCRPLS